MQFLDQSRVTVVAWLQHDEGLQQLAAISIRYANDAALGNARVLQQDRLHFRAGDVVAGGDDDVVHAGVEVVVAIGIGVVGVTGDVPAVANVELLTLIGQVAAAGWALERQPAFAAGGYRLHILVDQHRAVARQRLADGADAIVVRVRGDVDVNDLGAADAIVNLDAGRRAPLVARRHRQCLTGGDALLERTQVVLFDQRRHLPIPGR